MKKEIKMEVLERDGYSCQFCYTHRNLDSPHHILYRSRGGKDESDNLITLCRKCHDFVHANNVKISKTVDGEWMFLQPKSKVSKCC